MRRALRLCTGLSDQVTVRRMHAVATVVWLLLVVPTLLWWNQSILWIALMSVWANFAAHLSGYQGARAEKANGDN